MSVEGFNNNNNNNTFCCLKPKLWECPGMFDKCSPDRKFGQPITVYFEFHVRYFQLQQQRDNNTEKYVMVDFSKLGFTEGVTNIHYKKILDTLSDLNVSQEYQEKTLLPAIKDFVEKWRNDPRNAKKLYLELLIGIDILTTKEQNDYESDVMAPIILKRKSRHCSRLPDRRNLLPTPNLKRVKLSGDDDSMKKVGDKCSICLETPRVGTEIAQMDCSHVYHWDCIVKWLYKSNMCPLCRRTFVQTPLRDLIEASDGEALIDMTTSRKTCVN